MKGSFDKGLEEEGRVVIANLNAKGGKNNKGKGKGRLEEIPKEEFEAQGQLDEGETIVGTKNSTEGLDRVTIARKGGFPEKKEFGGKKPNGNQNQNNKNKNQGNKNYGNQNNDRKKVKRN